MPSPNTEGDRGQGLFLIRSDASADKDLTSRPGNDPGRDDRIRTVSAPEVIASADPLDTDAASTIARSTFSGYSEQKYLLSSGRRATLPHGPRKTAGRKAYLGVCWGLDLFVPIDINEEATSMQDSSLAKLVRVVKRNEKPPPHDRNTSTSARVAATKEPYRTREAVPASRS